MRFLLMVVLATTMAWAWATSSSDTRMDSQNGVLVEMTLVDPAAAMSEGRFEWDVVLETHSGDLRPLNLETRAELHATDGRALAVGLTFEVTADSAHHPAGRLAAVVSDEDLAGLRTTEAGGDVLSFYVVIHDVGGAAERRFAWSLPLGTEHVAMRAYVANAGDGTISVIDLDALEEVARWTVGTEASHGLALLPDGGTLYAGTGQEGDVVALDTRDGSEMRRVRGNVNAHGIDRTPDGRYVFVGAGGTNDTAHLLRIDTRSGDLTHVTYGLDPVGHIDVSPDGSRLYVANLGTDGLTVLDTETLETIVVVAVGDGPNESRVTPDGGTVFVANWISSDVSVVDAESLKVTGTLSVGEGTHGVAITPDGGEVWITNRISNDVAILDPLTGGLVARIEAGTYANHVSFTPDGRLVLVTNARANELTIFDVASRAVVTTIPVGVEPHEIAIGPAPAPSIADAAPGRR